MSRRARDRYFDLLGVLLTGIKAPPGGVYAVAEGFRTRTYFTPVEANRANINAGWEMITLLRQHGHRAYEVFAHRPRGRVVFTDDRQIVVLERAPRRSDAGWSGDRTTIRRERGRAMIDFIHKMRGDVGCLGLK